MCNLAKLKKLKETPFLLRIFEYVPLVGHWPLLVSGDAEIVFTVGAIDILLPCRYKHDKVKL